jgi:hypothetical protein
MRNDSADDLDAANLYCEMYKKILSRAKKTGRQNHALTQQKMLHCKMVVNIITYHHVV